MLTVIKQYGSIIQSDMCCQKMPPLKIILEIFCTMQTAFMGIILIHEIKTQKHFQGARYRFFFKTANAQNRFALLY